MSNPTPTPQSIGAIVGLLRVLAVHLRSSVCFDAPKCGCDSCAEDVWFSEQAVPAAAFLEELERLLAKTIEVAEEHGVWWLVDRSLSPEEAQLLRALSIPETTTEGGR